MEKSNWTLFIPIYNLSISNDIGGEIRIEDVSFISSKKIPYIRKKLGLEHTISVYKSWLCTNNIKEMPFEDAEVYACLKTKRSDTQVLSREFGKIKDAIYLLASSQYFRVNRDSNTAFGGPEFKDNIIDNYFLFKNKSDKLNIRSAVVTPIREYTIDKQWQKYLRNHFFLKLLKILNDPKRNKEDWRNCFKRCAILAGQSQFSKNIYEAFLYNMIILEILLTRKGDKFPDKIIERLIALFGWFTKEDPRPWEEIIKRLYRLRCDFVHDGISKDITIKDVLYSDMIAFNTLRNLVNLEKTIKNKDDVINLAKKIEALRFLKKPLKRPNGLRYSTKNIEEIESKINSKLYHWCW